MAQLEKPILIIGAHGMLGRPVTRRLFQDRFQIKAIARDPDRARGVLPFFVEVFRGDLASVPSIDSVMHGCQAVYVSVDTKPGEKFRAETEGLSNVIKAARNHTNIRLFVLSALQNSNPQAKTHPWWHIREKYEAQQIAKESGLSWTILEPAWFMESIPLFIKGKTFSHFNGADFESYWVSGDDMGRMISSMILKDIGHEEIVPVQGLEKVGFKNAAERFIKAYDPSIRTKKLPLWMLKGAGFFSREAKELATLLRVVREAPEPSPRDEVWEKYGKPVMTIETYAGYCRGTTDFPRK